ncbi:MAG: hypothetical protein J6584_05810 [Lactobacillus sp.]|jgi:hypothetical protein|uniref:Uncharacterized protein n=1 Tax=Bombilactobacillus bombi TaxID=1303590 RepID=A0A347ST03_9LACO|nr:hypothetical protein [Bombilactobacillus bombi]MCO6541202.1 hypothetical protein [Lactobacillus sp.]AXX65162.1 hypothetical protein DS830_06585 [Bombilactobacillus bombi]MCO6543462.1 hypothetical protein [Lactobacillus sp.]RHW48827.1 hypothetical protein DS832_00095 [Bombilactobacillus bombi]RHW51106.1 hypothetical protein DS831_03525 [Bombilactobacillus bombi]
MEITAAQYQDKIAQKSYQNFTTSIQLTRRLAKSKIKTAVNQLCLQVQDAVDSGYLAQGQLAVTGLPFAIEFALQSGIINLPFQDYQKISHFFDKEETKTVKIYLVTVSEQINVSKLRIDQVAADPSKLTEQIDVIVEMVHDNLQQALENYDNQSLKKEDKDK